MRRLAATLLAVLFLGACGLPAQVAGGSTEDRQRQVLAGAIHQAMTAGARFSMSEHLQVSGGTVPKGQVLELSADSRSGRLLQDRTQFEYAFGTGQKRDYQIVVDGPQMYVQQHGSTAWSSIDFAQAIQLMPLARFELIRQSVLLSQSVGGVTVRPVLFGLERRYTVRPALEQMAQLFGDTGDPSALAGHASAEIDVVLGYFDQRLVRIEARLTYKDPSTGEEQRVDSQVTMGGTGAAPISVPTGATPITASQLFA